MVLGGHEDDCLVLGLHHAAEQVEQHSRFVVPAHVEERQLQCEDSAQPCATTATLVSSSGAGGLQRVGGTKNLNSPSPSHLELLTQLGLHIQADQHGLSEACGDTQDMGHTWDVLLGTPTWPSINPA